MSSVITHLRKAQERLMIADVGSLNPPKVYFWLQRHFGRRPRHRRDRFLRDGHRPLMRLCHPSKNGRLVSETASATRLESNADLKTIAAALAGHKFSGSHAACHAAWSLAPRPWAFVAQRIARCEDGWRKERGLRILRTIANKRPEVKSPIRSVYCSLIWTGSTEARSRLRRDVNNLLLSWRHMGSWVPVLKRARFVCSTSKARTLHDALSTASDFTRMLASDSPPLCRCCELIASDALWPSIVVDGERHIVATQGRVPWPSSLKHLAKWPASISLPPRREDLISSYRNALMSLRRRCQISDDGRLVEDMVIRSIATLWPELEQRAAICPIQWPDVIAARSFTAGLFIQIFDHNPSRLGFICMRLAWRAARKALELDGNVPSSPNFNWNSSCGTVEQSIQVMATVQGLSPELVPARLSGVPRSQWSVGTPNFLPKWKAPGIKWRLIINKRRTPCNRLHSLVSRAIDVALDHFPVELWSDFSSPLDFVTACRDFNAKVARLFRNPIGHTEAADMCDCFHHIPAKQVPTYWSQLRTYWEARGFDCVSVPKRPDGCSGRLGRVNLQGWATISFHAIALVLQHFTDTILFLWASVWVKKFVVSPWVTL